MDNAMRIPCDLLAYPTDPQYDEAIRQFQGCPTIAISRGGRIFLGWYSGGTKEPHMENYNLLIVSDDKGKTWSKPVLVIPSSKERMVHALDIQLWTAPDGKIHVYWVQNNVIPASEVTQEIIDEDQRRGLPHVVVGEYAFNDFRHTMWHAVCEEPDADVVRFTGAECLDEGFLRCKPTVLDSGRILFFNYSQLSENYDYSVSDDGGKTVQHKHGSKRVKTMFDEGMAYQKRDGSVRFFARTKLEEIAECTLTDEGETWTEAKLTGIDSPDTRFYVSRTPSGRVLLVNNDARVGRSHMTVYLSDDDGETWPIKRCVDPRDGLSYPDVDFCDGRIYLTYDRNRNDEAEIFLTSFTEEDLLDENYVFDISIVSKPPKQA